MRGKLLMMENCEMADVVGHTFYMMINLLKPFHTKKDNYN